MATNSRDLVCLYYIITIIATILESIEPNDLVLLSATPCCNL